MKELQELLAEAAHFKNRRSNLAQGLRDVDVRFKNNLEALESGHASKINNFEAERQAALSAIESRAKKEIADYIQMKNSLQQYIDPVRQWCPKSSMVNYTPNPSRVNEAEVNQLIRMLQEQGLMAWIKRTFKLDGYSSRADMALDLCRKIEDACAYCNERIAVIEARAEDERNRQVTETRRKIAAEQERFKNERHELELKQKVEKEQALTAINKFDNSEELKKMHTRIERMRVDAESSCGVWGEYTAPTVMPEQVLLCEAKITLPNANGVEETLALPVWVNLFECNIIVITSSTGSTSSTDCNEKLFVRKLLARMLKTVPPENCSYSVFDSLHKGASLERLIDVTNVGTTDLNFDLFTSDESDAKVVSCAERRKYLRNRPAEIIKFTAGRNKSLFEYNRESGDFEFPFTWYIDFNFPDEPDSRLMDDIKELFVNAPAAGYSFVFVTTPRGFEKIKKSAGQYTSTKVLHIDVDKSVCEKGGLELPYLGSGNPSSEQIYNFMTALKKYYDEGDSVNNRIDSVFSSKGIELRDASKKLTIPMALDSRGRLVDLELGGEGSVHGFISGGTNSGKSTLLHTIILSACLHYHPRDLEIWLVDYKQTEFYLYKKKTPPHIKLIGVSKTADFTFSLLDKIESEANRRTELMNRFDAQNLEEYRKHEGEPGYESIPRLFIVIDEFHEMSQFVATEMEYKDKLENILREYRAQGITCLMADQTFSTGLSGLTSAAKNQIGLRIAMRNEASPQEIKDTLEVDRAMYSDSMQHTIAIMSQGEFIMKVYVRNSRGELTDIKLEKFKGLFTKGDDIAPISKALRSLYKGQYSKDLLYVNTKEQVYWDDSEPAALDQAEPLRYPNVRLYLGRSATLRPCFGLDIGRQPDENLSIVGGTAYQRWELLASIMKSCKYRNYKLVVFMAEFSDLMSDFGRDIRDLCNSIPNAELLETMEDWCYKLDELEKVIDNRRNTEEIICIFIGLEIANIEMGRLPDKSGNGGSSGKSFLATISKYATPVDNQGVESDTFNESAPQAFNATPIIDKLFSSGARNGIRCVTEVSVYRQFSRILKIKDMCRHKIAFSMSADDCLMYLGNSNFQKSIGQNAVYGDGGKEVKKLLPYKL